MLQLSPELLATLRAAQAATDEKLHQARSEAARTQRMAKGLNQSRRQHMIDKTAAIMRVSEPTKFAFEGVLRHAMRSEFCLQGWCWADADKIAADIITAALNQVGAVRPTWKEAQPEYTQEGVIVEQRETCLRCRDPMPEGHWKFCSSLCAHAHKQAIMRVRRSEELAASRQMRRAMANQLKKDNARSHETRRAVR